MVGGDPANRDRVVVGLDPPTYFHCRYGEALTRSNGVGSYSVDGGGGVDEDSILASALLALFDDAECLVDGENLCIEDFLVGT